MKKLILSLLITTIFLALSGSSFAEGKGISPEKRKAIEKYFDLTMTDPLIETLANGFTQRYAAVASVGRTTEEKDLVEAIYKSTRKVLVDEFPKLKEQLIPLYDEVFTLEEIKKLVEFNQSPTGQKFNKVLPMLTQRGMELGDQWGASLIPKIEEDLKKKGIKLKE